MRCFEAKDVVKGCDVVLEGLISGSAPFEITYLKDSKQIRTDRRHTMSLKNDIATLQVLKFDASDAGNYQCTVANDVGKTSCEFQISLKGWLAATYISYMYKYNVLSLRVVTVY